MKAATSIANITPHCDVHLCGYVGEDRKYTAKGVHDDPLAVSILLDIDGVRLLFVSIDVIAICKEKADFIKCNICDIINIQKDNIIINGIHSHSLANGFMKEEAFGTPSNEVYFHYVNDQIIDSIKNLENDLQEVHAEIGTTKVHGYYSKRTDITQPFEDNAAIIKFKHGETLIAAMCNFNCHATVLGPKNMMLSADLIGEVRRRIGEDLGVIPYTFTGASGDISNRQYRQGNDFQELYRVGKGVADILKGMDNYEELHLEHVSMHNYDYLVAYDNTKYYQDYEQGLENAKKILKNENISLDEWKMAMTEKTLFESKLQTKEVSFHVSGKVWKTNDLTIVTFPGELASRFGLELRAKCKTKHFLLIGYADDYQGYFIEQEEYGKTYETKASNTPKGVSESIVQEIGELL